MSDSSYLNLNGLKTLVNNVKSYTDSKVASIVDSAPETLNTLNELSQALGDDENFATTVATEIGTKASQSDLDSLTTTVNKILNAIYPVGSVYISTVNKSPATFFGGTWELIAKDRMLVGAGNKYSAGATGGAETVALSTTQVPKVEGRISMHNGYTATNVHQVDGCFSAGITNEKYILEGSGTTGATSVGQIRFSNGGTGAAHNNMPPYLAVYMWKRTA